MGKHFVYEIASPCKGFGWQINSYYMFHLADLNRGLICYHDTSHFTEQLAEGGLFYTFFFTITFYCFSKPLISRDF